MSDAGLEGRFTAAWYGDSPLGALLAPLAALYAAIVHVRRLAYRRGWLASVRLPVPVIVVGNITAGGTGKTPVVEWLVRRLREAGFRPGIVSRGYGGRVTRRPLRVSPRGDPGESGDEPLLLVRRTGLPVVVCPDRVAAARALIEEGVDVIVSDDGLQHYALQRDAEVAVVDGRRGLGNGRLLPAGPLREPPARLSEVDLVLVNDGAFPGATRFALHGDKAVALRGDQTRNLRDFAGVDVWAVAGVGHPQRFHDALRAAGLRPVPVPVRDHGTTDLGLLRATSPRPILMTEKDAVKYADCPVADAWYVPVSLQMDADDDASAFGRILARLPGRSG
jgi:tetraacyldisaccharide 4'-kinase